jgi:hypothetical protein
VTKAFTALAVLLVAGLVVFRHMHGYFGPIWVPLFVGAWMAKREEA